jgi:hypothetical protein
MDRFKKIIEDLIKEIETEEMDEATTTGAVAGYNTPNAFKKTDGTDDEAEPDADYVDYINRATGYKRVNENRWLDLKNDESTPNQKIGKGIREMRKQLQEIEKFIEWYSKIKTENDLDSSQYWKRTQKHLNVMKERLNKIAIKIDKL